MKVRLTSIGLLFALMSAFVLVPAGSALAKNDKAKKAHPFKGVKAQGKFGDATVNVTEFGVNSAGKLVAHGNVTSEKRGTLATFRDAPVTVKVGRAANAQQGGASLGMLQEEDDTCEILTLTLAPITLNLLGLIVETSEINLVITGERGEGDLLGNLLCGIADLLNDDSALARLLNRILDLLGGLLSGGSALTGATPLTITSFSNQNGQLMANFFVNGDGQVFGPFSTPVQVQQTEEGCEVLRLVLGPIFLNLLGLVVELFGETREDPITIVIRGETGPGNLLGNLICGLVGLLDDRATAARDRQIVNTLNRILKAAG